MTEPALTIPFAGRRPVRRHAIGFVAACCAGLVVVGCGPAIRNAGPPTIEDLRRRAADAPDDADAQRELAAGELLLSGGDASRAREQIQRALALAPRDERVSLLAGMEAELHGDPARATGGYVDALEAAAASADRDAPFVAETAVGSLRELSNSTPGFIARVEGPLEGVLASPGAIGPVARHGVGLLLAELAYRRGATDAAQSIERSLGCPASWRVAGPFGPWDLLGFDSDTPATGAGPLADRYDLGPGRGERETRDHDAQGCAIHLGQGPIAAGGTTVAETSVTAPTAGTYVVRLESPNPIELFIDGTSVARLDRRRERIATTTFHEVELTAGQHEISMKIASRHPNPVAAVAIRPASDRNGRRAMQRPVSEGIFGDYLRTVVALSRGDIASAQTGLARHAGTENASTIMLVLRSAAVLGDPLMPADVRRDSARRYLRMAKRRDDNAWYPVAQLARLEAAEGHADRAIDSLRHAHRTWPNVIDIALTLDDLLIGKGWLEDSDEVSRRAYERAPDVCRTINAVLRSARRRDRVDAMESLVDAAMACDARSDAGYRRLIERRSWAEARAELARLASLTPRQDRAGLVTEELDLARAEGDDAAVARILSEHRQRFPRDTGAVVAETDRFWARGDSRQALHTIDAALVAEPAAMLELTRLRRALDGASVLEPYRLNGAEILRQFEASGRTYDEPQVLVLDYTVIRVYPDGSSLELTHNIFRLQSEEAVDEHGEFQVPDGAHLLALHTIKADGRRIEPDAIAGKETVSLPSLSPGDYVEFEYVRPKPPPRSFPGGYAGDRFYFRSFEVPFDRSELTLIMPENMPMALDPRGPAPQAVERRTDGLRVMRFRVDESRPLVAEPQSVAAREFIPSVNVGVNATWDSFATGLRDVLSDRDVADRGARRLAVQVAGDAANSDPGQAAARLYDWVLENIEDNNDLFGMAPAMLKARAGNRTRVLRYLLGLVHIRADLALARSVTSDQTRSELADGDTYEHPLLAVELGDERVILWTASRGAAFGYLPPQLRGQDAILLDEQATRLTLPNGDGSDDHRLLEIVVRMDEGGGADVHVMETLHGIGAVTWRDNLEGIPEAMLEQRFEEAYVARLVAGAELTSLVIHGREDRSEPLKLEYAFTVPAFGSREGGLWTVPGIFPTRVAPVHARQPSRTTAQVVLPGLDLDVVVEVHLPEGAEFARTPTDQNLSAAGSRFTLRTTREDRELRIERRIRMPIMRVETNAYEAFAQFCRSVDEFEAQEIAIRM